MPTPEDVAAEDRGSQVHSIAQWISEFGGSLLFEAGFSPNDTDKEELMEILRSLEDCREEGRALYPDIILTSRREECLRAIYKAEFVRCGEFTQRSGRIRRALKRALPLTVEPWAILIDVKADRLVYGLVSMIHRADAPPFYEQLLDVARENPGLPVLHMRRHGTRGVLVRTAHRETVISLTLSEELLKAQGHIEAFVKAATSDPRMGEPPFAFEEAEPVLSDLDDGQQSPERSEQLRLEWEQRKVDWATRRLQLQERDTTRIEARRAGASRILRGLIEQACREGHGLIVCAVDPENFERAKARLTDGAYLDPVLDLRSPERDEGAVDLSVENDASLRARIALGRRMVECDLVTMFSTDGRVLGYNIHVPNTENISGVSGGARSRAFAALSTGEAFRPSAVLMCSQDGQTKIFPENAP